MLGTTRVGALSDQYLVVRIKKVDADKLRAKVGGGAAIAAALAVVNTAPKAVLDVAAPYLAGVAKDYGIDADVTHADFPPAAGKTSEFWPGMGVGAGLLGACYGIFRLIKWLW